MKKFQVDHVLRAAHDITGAEEFIIVGSQALHGKHPDLPDAFGFSAEVDLYVKGRPSDTEKLNEIGIDSPFHETHGFYADPVDEKTATLPRGWQGRLVHWPPGATGGARAQCLEPHDLAISKYVARREKDVQFTRALARRGITNRDRLLSLLEMTPVSAERKMQIRGFIEQDFQDDC